MRVRLFLFFEQIRRNIFKENSIDLQKHFFLHIARLHLHCSVHSTVLRLFLLIRVRVHPHAVVSKVQLSGEALFALRTFERLRDGRVEISVPQHVASPPERQTAHVTLERLLVCVGPHVVLDTPPVASKWAVDAPELSFHSIPAVPLQLLLCPDILTTEIRG